MPRRSTLNYFYTAIFFTESLPEGNKVGLPDYYNIGCRIELRFTGYHYQIGFESFAKASPYRLALTALFGLVYTISMALLIWFRIT